MNIVINTSTLNKGGALQVAYSVVQELMNYDSNNNFLVICSSFFYEQVKGLNWPDNFSYYIIHNSPAKIVSRTKIVKELDTVTLNFNADVVLTVFGPSYWRPKVRHICGFADGWCYYPETIAYTKLKFVERLKRRLLSRYKLYHLKKEVDVIFIETEDARGRLVDLLGVEDCQVVTVSNTYSKLYDFGIIDDEQILGDRTKEEIRFLLLSANYPHKNIQILNSIIPILKGSIKNFRFILTIPQLEFERIVLNEYRQWVINVGPVDVKDCIKLYNETDFLFLPTLLETFTATYPEAMRMKKLILTSDLPFAKDICDDAAIYFNPIDANDVVEKIVSVIYNDDRQEEIVNIGSERVKTFPSALDRAKSLLQLCINNE